MRFTPAFAYGLILSLGGAVVVGPMPALAAKKESKSDAPSLKPSPEFLKLYGEVEKLNKANDFANAKTKIAEAEQAAKTPDDQYLLGTLKLNVGLGLKDESYQRQGLEAMLASGKASPADAPKFHTFAGQFALKANDYDAAIQHLNSAIQGNSAGSAADLLLAEAYFGKGYENIANNQLTPAGKQLVLQGLPHLKRAIDIEEAAGKPAPGGWYSRGFRMAALANSPDLPQWTAITLKSDPNPDNWRIALRTFQDGNRAMTRDENLDVLRLMAATGALKDQSSYGEYVEAAMKSGLIGEAKSVIDSGRAAGVLSSSQFADSYQTATAGIAKDKGSLPADAAAAAKAANGRSAVATANAYLGYGDYAKAAELYRLALQKGGVDADEVNSRLGIALARSGDTAGAKAAFAAVKSAGVRKTIAEFWTTWLNSRSA